MSYAINTRDDVDQWDLEDLETFIKADEFNGKYRPDVPRIINPALELELGYAPTGYVCNGA